MQNQTDQADVRSFQFTGEINRTDSEWIVVFPDGRRERFPVTMRLSDLAEAIGAAEFDYHSDIRKPVMQN